jgi:hypothetical protein
MGIEGSGGLRVVAVVGCALALVLGGTAACSTAAPYGNTDDQVVSGKAREPAKKSSASKDPDDRSTPGSMAVTKIDPPSVKAGSAPGGLSVTVTGTGFEASSKVAIGGRAVATTFGSATSLTATIPGEALGAAGGLALSVVGTASRSNELSLMVYDSGGSLVTGISPTSTTPRTSNLSLIVNGNGFAPGATVVFNGTDVFTTVESASSVRATVPGSLLGSAGQFNVSVKSGGGVSAPIVFTVQHGGFSSSGGSSGGFGFCDNGGVSCMEIGLAELDCMQWGGTVVQCEDGCVYNGCY